MIGPPVLTLQRPWGWAIVYAGKPVENRTWSTRYRGPLFIHQGKGRDRDARSFAPMAAAGAVVDTTYEDAAGVILGWAQLVDCHQQAPGCCETPWAMPEQWHWVLADPRPLIAPVEAKGALGLWRPEPVLLDQLRAAA